MIYWLLHAVFGMLLILPWQSVKGIRLLDAAVVRDSGARIDFYRSAIASQWMLALPLYDTVGVMCRRIARRQSPFHADRLHTHHLLQNLGMGVNQSLAVLVTFSVLMACIGLVAAAADVPQSTMFYIFLSGFAIYLVLMEWGQRRV